MLLDASVGFAASEIAGAGVVYLRQLSDSVTDSAVKGRFSCCSRHRPNVRLGSLADIVAPIEDVRFAAKSGHAQRGSTALVSRNRVSDAQMEIRDGPNGL